MDRQGKQEIKKKWKVDIWMPKVKCVFLSVFFFCLLPLLPSLLYLLWRSLISCRPNVDFILELGA